MSSKTNSGNFFEDFQVGQELPHATPRTVTEGDVALYTGLYGMRFALNSSETFAQSLGLPGAPIDDLLVFHIVFGKTVPDISLNAVANLGYAGGVFGVPVYPGDTLDARSEVIGVKENSNGKTGVVYVRSVGRNQRGETVLDYVRWVMVRKRDADHAAPPVQVPDLPTAVSADDLKVPAMRNFDGYNPDLSGSRDFWEHYEIGERIDHIDGMTIEESEHMIATRLYQNTAKVHFNQHEQQAGRFGKRLIYGGHIISLARGLSFNGLANGLKISAINGGAHTNPSFAGDTIYAWSEVVDKFELPEHDRLSALRMRTVACKNRPCNDFPRHDDAGKYLDDVVLDFDYTILIPTLG